MWTRPAEELGVDTYYYSIKPATREMCAPIQHQIVTKTEKPRSSMVFRSIPCPTLAMGSLEAGILGQTVGSSLASQREAILSTPFHGATWSDNIWTRQKVLRTIVAKGVETAILRGRNPHDIVPMIRKEFKVGVYEARRLAITEVARVQTEVQKLALETAGFSKYEISHEDRRWVENGSACHICSQFLEKPYDVKDLVPGVTAPPFHPFCRCAVVPVVGDGEGHILQEQAAFISAKDGENSFSVNRKLVNSKAFHDKFEQLPFSKNVNEALYQSSLKILEHRDGTDVEDFYVLNGRTGREVTKNISATTGLKVGLNNAQYQKLLDEDEVVLLHNHPGGGRLSYADIKSVFTTPNVKGSVVVGHDGDVFVLYSPNRAISVEKIYQKLYNEFVDEFHNKELANIKATDALYKMGVFSYAKIK